MAQHTGDELIALARSYMADTGMALTRLGRLAAGNNRLFLGLLKGEDCLLRAGELASLWFAEHWPPHLA